MTLSDLELVIGNQCKWWGPATYWEFKLRNRISHPLEQRLENGGTGGDSRTLFEPPSTTREVGD